MNRFANALLLRRRAFCFLVVAVGFPVLFSACSRRELRADLVLVNGAEPQSLDPAIVSGQPDGRAASSLFEGLLQFDPKTGEPIPAIAERYEKSTDGLFYTFFIRSNALWSTGEPITAHDFVWSWRRAAAPETAADYAGQLFYIKNAEAYCTGQTNPVTGRRFTGEDMGVQAVNDRTLLVELVAPTPFFPDLCAFRTLAVVPRKALEKYGDRWVRAPGTSFSGAFTLQFWRVNDRIRVVKNPRYWDAANVKVNTVDFLPQHDPNFALNIFLQGDADLIFDKRRMPAELMDKLRDEPYFHGFEVLSTFFYRYNVTREPFKDPRVRQALGMAVDKRRIVENITRSGEKVATAMTPPGTRGYEAPEGLRHDPEAARKLLAEAGYPGGQGFPLFRYLTPNMAQMINTAIELRQMWEKELGIHMEIQQTEWKVYLSEQSRTNFDVSYSAWIGDYNDPNTFLDMFMSNNGNNRTGWNNPRYDALIREANAEADTTKRAALLHQAETILVRQDVPLIPLYYEKGINLYRSDEIGGVWGNLLDEHAVSAMYRKKPPGKSRPTSR